MKPTTEVEQNSNENVTPEKLSAINIFYNVELDPSYYRIGINQVYLRAGVLSYLENVRDEKLTDCFIHFEAHCRGYLARKRLVRLKVETSAIKCIQKNVRMFLRVHNWSWWCLLTRILPIVNVTCKDETLKLANEQIETLKQKCEKMEEEREMLKEENVLLEKKLAELATDLVDEHSSSSYVTERMNAERENRMKLEKEVQVLKGKNMKLEEAAERLELELLCNQSTSGIDNDSDDGEADTVSKAQFNSIKKELEYTKRKYEQQRQYDMDQLMCLKKQLEKKVSDAYEELDEQKQLVGQWKRKFTKQNTEFNDIKLHLDELNSRSNILEKKHKKFDGEYQMLNSELKQMKACNEKLMREKDLLFADKSQLEDTVQILKSDLELKDKQIKNITEELNDQGSTDEVDLFALKKNKMQLENKCSNLEEELDDCAAQIQVLENTKLKLEMTLEQVRKENKKELNQREEEADEIRINAQKKLKAMECELENEKTEKSLILREKYELERKVMTCNDNLLSAQSDADNQIRKIRNDLKKTKALLRDARLTAQSKSTNAGKALIRQLKNQIEDSDLERITALKSKQNLEAELLELSQTLDELKRQKTDVEDKLLVVTKERDSFNSRLEENEDELSVVLKKYNNTVNHIVELQNTIEDQTSQINSLEQDKAHLKEELVEIQCKLGNIGNLSDSSSFLQTKALQLKVKELESKIDLDEIHKNRLEIQLTRLKEQNEKTSKECQELKLKDIQTQDANKKISKQLSLAQEDKLKCMTNETELMNRIKEGVKKIEFLESENTAVKADLRLAMQRIDELQIALNSEVEDQSLSESVHSGNSSDSDSPYVSKFLVGTSSTIAGDYEDI